LRFIHPRSDSSEARLCRKRAELIPGAPSHLIGAKKLRCIAG
jgi:hypothetical protein